ncbi:ATP-binding protein [Rheinheimera sp. UJ51]|uniref:AAA family ATPase n=1 Tax=Rheinheimera sp. UJ51 TaxID=2892446 RepID=UPI001E44AAD3|nr:ATP-binding protein [Rheinheimera sp. UJ51]MCC5451799.1 ATP-binding protein [Rheinheimera sp. UJ51]
MEQIFLNGDKANTLVVNPIISTDLAIAVRWLINIQQHFCRYRCEKVLTGLGVPDELAFAIFTEEADLNYNAIINLLDTFIANRPPLALDKNIQVFGTMIGLTPIEIAVFRFVLIARTWVGIFNDVQNARYYSSSNDTYEILANCIGANLYDVELALHDKSPLALCGLVKQERGHTFIDHFRTMNVFGKLFSDQFNPQSLLEQFCTRISKPELNLTDFDYLAEQMTLASKLISAAINLKQRGCNILIYGLPGTGKTEIAKLLAYQNSQQVTGVSAGFEQEVYVAKSRLNALLMCQKIYGVNADHVVILDEADDVLPSQVGILLGNTDAQKLAINTILETNHCPCIWICNSIKQFDPAQLRRFSQIIPVNVPPKNTRLKIAQRYLQNTGVSAAYIDELAADDNVTPALLARLWANNNVLGEMPSSQKERYFDLVLNPMLEAQTGRTRIKPAKKRIRPELYNSDYSVAELINYLTQATDLKLCIYGPPGTGKTSFAKYLADQLGRPLLQKKASELLGSYVGETERAIAMAFCQAQNEEAILLLDEVDTLISHRNQTERHWQKTMTNELLMQLDHYQGILVCTTNFIEQIDAAALRRFDVKVQLSFLKPEQAKHLFHECVTGLGLSEPSSQSLASLERMQLTPADFELVKKQMRFKSFEEVNADIILTHLKAETVLRGQVQPRIGFVH